MRLTRAQRDWIRQVAPVWLGRPAVLDEDEDGDGVGCGHTAEECAQIVGSNRRCCIACIGHRRTGVDRSA